MAKKSPSSRKPKAAASSDAGAFLGAAATAAPVATLPPHPAPIELGAVFGQDRAVGLLRSALASGRPHHAWIFHGPSGVGKFTTALAFASLLLDPTTEVGLGGEWQADPDSPVQRMLRAGTHPDLHVITKELARFSADAKVRDAKLISIPKDVVETHLIAPAALAASVRNDARASKVFIVDEAELLDRSTANAPVQNALLKTIEEPPERTFIILVTSSEDQLLTTIRSRCQRVAFTAIGDAPMRAWARREAPEAAPEEMAWLVSLAEGSPGMFRLAKASGLYEWHTQVSPLLARCFRGEYDPTLGATMAKLVNDWAEAWVKAHDNASKEAANKAGADWMFRLVSERLRAMLREWASGGRDPSPLLTSLELIREAERRFDASVQGALVFEALSADLSAAFAGEFVA